MTQLLLSQKPLQNVPISATVASSSININEKEKQRKWVWTSYNDPLNNLTIKTSGTPNGTKGNPFNQDTIIIITADKGTDQRIRSAAVSAGYSEEIINTYVVPSSMVKLGTGPEYDTIVFGHRMALFAD